MRIQASASPSPTGSPKLPRVGGAGGAICPESDFAQSWLGARPLSLLKCSETCWGKWSFELA